MQFKKPTFPLCFRRLNKKGSGRSSLRNCSGDDAASDGVGVGGSRRWSFKSSSTGLLWKRKFTVYTWFIDGFLFKIVYVLEAVVLGITLVFFYLCCGCHI